MEHGDYQVLRARDSQMIHRSEIASTVKPEMVLEMSIVMRQSAALHDNRGKCPQCRHMNLCAKETSGWVEWCVPLHFDSPEIHLRQSPTAPNVQDNFRS